MKGRIRNKLRNKGSGPSFFGEKNFFFVFWVLGVFDGGGGEIRALNGLE